MTSDQSVSSTSSRVRQFGLYRTIDARTEEFLRLSRRRQIRQGCACAAVSTAITVTIIVSILLVFEINIIPKTEIKTTQDWLGLVNRSAEGIPSDEAKLNIDKTTLKLLTILIKALHENKYLNKIIGDNTTPKPHPAYERQHTTEFTYKKNVFSDRKNWLRYPTSRVLAIEYKTSPIMYFKTPKNDYFTKIRKIRDYQRIMNYVDKMISDRVTFGSTQPMKKYEDYVPDSTHIPTIVTKPINQRLSLKNFKGDSVMSQISITTTKNTTPKNEKLNSCKCPKQISEILNNLLSNIQLLMPYYATTESIIHTSPCDNTNAKVHSSKEKSTSFNPIVTNRFEKINEKRLRETAEAPWYSTPNLKANKQEYILSNLTHLKKNHANKTTVHPKFIRQKIYSIKTHSQRIATTPPMAIERTEMYEEKSTMPILNKKITKYDPLHFNIISTGSKLQHKNHVKKLSSELDFNESNYEVDFGSTTDISDSFINLDAHSLELVKKKIITTSKKTKKIIIKQPYTNIKINHSNKIPKAKSYNVYSNIPLDSRKIFYPITSVHYLYHRHNTTMQLTSPKTITGFVSATKTKELSIAAITDKTTPTISTTKIPVATTSIIANTSKLLEFNDTINIIKNKPETEFQLMNQKSKEESTYRSDEINLDDDFEKIIIEENYQEDDLKDRPTDDTMSALSNDLFLEQNVGRILTKLPNKQADFKEREKNTDFLFTSNALHNKPRSYFEIQRNYVKHDDNYDLNLK
ncbi:unnamed protein product [Parnassius mnemosyne]|uniref:Uncharacterized protein n=1 Tax=Parnassius mnemosyne TaxID=213953 RepID=A0AAV1M7S3_9NEOP